MQKFSLIEELLLLTLEDRGGEFDRVPEAFLVGADRRLRAVRIPVERLSEAVEEARRATR